MQETDPVEVELVVKAAEDALDILNKCSDSGMQARGIVKTLISGDRVITVSVRSITVGEFNQRLQDAIKCKDN